MHKLFNYAHTNSYLEIHFQHLLMRQCIYDWCALSPFPFWVLLTNIDFILKRMISQNSHHKYGNSQRVTTIVRILGVTTHDDDDMYYIFCNPHISLFLCTIAFVCVTSYGAHGLGNQKVNHRKEHASNNSYSLVSFLIDYLTILWCKIGLEDIILY